ncbi:MAG: cytochrome C [Deltaproteobacteria bacterium HGW-Deltaproteobacteria-14]|nr:MAG: cytochrome C [Deltaproteobacteria bacterium HGW-Deltaproteobacteria-14]
MAQIFPRWTNKIPLAVAVTTPVVLVGVIFAIWYWFSPKFTDVGYQPEQPVQFSHKLHAGTMGLDCRYCHNTVEQAAHAALPPAGTCMNCHGNLDLGDRENRIKPIKDAFAGGAPVEWVRVHMLPDYAYFNHSVHLAAGVGCSSCHGRIDQMDTVFQDQPLSMSWCLDCHRNPQPNLRPRDQVTNMGWFDSPEAAAYDPNTDPTRTRAVAPPEHCSGCHR